jgi:hypothetical protein
MSTLAILQTNTRNTYLKIDPNGKVWSDDVVDYYINRWYERVQQDFGYDIPECETSTTISTVWWTTEYNKPTDFVRVVGLFQDSYTLSRITKQQFLTNRASQTKPSSFYIYGDKIGLYPTPDWVYSLDLLYKKKLPEITDLVDSELNVSMEDLMILWACYLMFLSVEKNDKATMCLNQYTQAKDALFAQELYDDEQLVFGTQYNNTRVRDDAL